MKFLFLAVPLLLLLTSCREPEPFPENERDDRLSGGVNTVFDATSKSFSHEFPNLPAYDLSIHELGDRQFSATFVAAPAPVNSGLGPIYNNVSCISCHHNDGIGVPTAGEQQSSLLLRVSVPGVDSHGGPSPVPGLGTQLQDKAIFGFSPEGTVTISYSYQSSSFPDGETFELRVPTYSINGATLPAGVMISPRLAPPVIGLGLLEALPVPEILSHEDETDVDGDGISGKANEVWDPTTNSMQLGRFGWKANTASLLAQVATAFQQDIGVTNRVLPVESSRGQQQDDRRSDDPELPDSILQAVKFYVQSLSVPARRNVTDPGVVRGEQLFTEAKCSRCHLETMTTGVNVAFPAASNQVIHPYTDLLLHDMGPGLADGRPDFKADGQEWRTAPLWGVGLFSTVNYPPYYLHDGRARSLVEAIMWHGGEADSSKDFFRLLKSSDRQALIEFLNSL